MTTLAFTTLGRLRCFMDERELVDLTSQRLRCGLLVYLAVERGASRETLANLFWSDRDDERSRQALKQTVYELRRALGWKSIVSQGEQISIAAETSTDTQDFEEAVQRRDWQRALDLYAGSFLEGFYVPRCQGFESWLDRYRARLGRLHRTTRRERITELLSAGDISVAVAVARRWVEIEPLEDEAQHRLIDLLARQGNRAEALRQYESYQRELLKDNLEPLQHTRVLIEQIRAPSFAVDALPLSEALPARRTESPAAVIGPPSSSRLYWLKWGAAAIAAFALLLLAGQITREPAPASRRSIVVLPFANHSADPTATEYLADGIADELTSDLSQLSNLDVVSRTSAVRFKSRGLSLAALGDSLSAGLAIEGGLIVERGQIHMTVALIDVTSGKRMWATEYDGTTDNTILFQDSIARTVAAALAIELNAAAKARLAARNATSHLAYDEYLRGRYLSDRRDKTSVLAGIAHLARAASLDPAYASAHAALAYAYAVASNLRYLPRDSILPIAQRAAERAIALDRRLAEAHNALGRVHVEKREWKQAEKSFNRALKLDPNYHQAYGDKCRLLRFIGRYEEAVRIAEEAEAREPFLPQVVHCHAIALWFANQNERAYEKFGKAIEIQPTWFSPHRFLGRAYFDANKFDEAIDHLQTSFALADSDSEWMRNMLQLRIASTHIRAGRRGEAARILAAIDTADTKAVPRYELAVLQMALGNQVQALAYLELGKQLDKAESEQEFYQLLDREGSGTLYAKNRVSPTC